MNPVNDIPIANSQSIDTAEDSLVTITLTGSDIENAPLSFVLDTQPVYGTLTGAAPNLTYQPFENVNGQDQFSFSVSDAELTSETATVEITISAVNDAPVADNQSLNLLEDGSVDLVLSGQDIDGDPLNYQIVVHPSVGSLTGTAPNLTYIPIADASGSDSFSFIVNDSLADSALATVNLTIQPVNDAPTVTDLSLTTSEDSALDLVLAANDLEGDTLTYSIVTGPGFGSLSGTAPNLSYLSNPNQNGTDTFTYLVNDGEFDSTVATVQIEVTSVNDAPTSNDLSISLVEDSSSVVTLTGEDVDGDSLSFEILVQPTNGILSGTAPNLVYTSNADYFGSDSFQYRVNDGVLDSAASDVSIEVTAVNDVPTANDQTLNLSEDGILAITLTAQDIEGDALSYSVVNTPVGGQLTGTPPNLTYTPNANINGSDSFSFRVNDGLADSNEAVIDLAIAPVNDSPVAQDLSYALDEDANQAITLVGTDIEGDSLSYALVSLPSQGALTGTAPNLTYTPTENYSGTDQFSYLVNDGVEDSALASVDLQINPVNDPPAITSSPINEVTPGQDYIYQVSVSDVDSSTFNYVLDESPLGMTINPFTGAVSWPLASIVEGTYTVTISVDDFDGGVDTQSYSLLADLNTEPVFTSIPGLNAYQGELYDYQISAYDAEGGLLTFNLVQGPIGMSIDGDGRLTWLANTDSGLSVDVGIIITDEGGKSVTQNYALSVTPLLVDPTIPGTEFWVTFLRTINDQYPALYLTSEYDTTATISIVGVADPIVVNIFSGQFTTVDLTPYVDTVLQERHISELKTEGAVQIVSPLPISGYAENRSDFVTDTTALIPLSESGTEYFAASWNQGFMFVIATEDNTQINITEMAHSDVGKRRIVGQDSVTLNLGEIYHLETASTASDRFSGSFVQSDKPVVTYSGEYCPLLPDSSELACDHLMEQLVDTSKWGSNYTTAPIFTRNRGDFYTVVSAFDNTFVWIDNELVAELQRGDFYTTDLLNPAVIESNNPIQVAQFSTSASYDFNDPSPYAPVITNYGDPYMTMLQAEHQFRDIYLASEPNSRFTYNYYSVVIDESAANTLNLDGGAMAATITQTVPNSDKVVLSGSLSAAPHEFTADIPFGLYLYGYYDQWESYGHVGAHAPAVENLVNSWTIVQVDGVPVGTDACVVIRFTDLNGYPVSGEQVFLSSVIWPIGNTSGVSDSFGNVELCIEGLAPGTTQVTLSHALFNEVVDLQWTSAPTNLPPQLTQAPSTYLSPGVQYQEQLVAIDPEGSVVEYRLISGPAGLAIDLNTGLVSYYSEEVPFESVQVELDLADDLSSIQRVSFPIVQDPGFSRPPVLIFEAPALVTADIQVSHEIDSTDPDGDPVTYEIVSGHPGMSLDVSVAGAFLVWTPEAASQGLTLNYTLAAVDVDGERDEQTYSSTVVDNQTPYFSREPLTDVKAGRLYQYLPLIVDPDGDPTSFSIVNAPAGAYVTPDFFNWDVPPDANGTYSVTLEATDDKGATVQKSFDVEVEPNYPPIFGEPRVGSITQDVYSTPQGMFYFVFVPLSEPDGDSYNVTATLPAGMTFSTGTSGGETGVVLSWTPAVDEPLGTRNIEIVATDSFGAASVLAYDLEVVLNEAPVFSSTPPGIASTGISYSWPIAAYDPEGWSVAFELISAPAGMTLNAANRLVWTPDVSNIGSNVVQIRATDSFGAVNLATFNIDVVANQPPVFTLLPDIGARNNILYVGEIFAEDPESQSVSYQLLNGPAGMTFSTGGITVLGAGVMRYTPTAEGVFSVSVQATDAQGNTSIYNFDLTVIGDELKIIGFPDFPEIYAEREYQYQMVALHPSLLPASFTITSGPIGATISSAGLLSWTPAADQTGLQNITVRAETSDGQFDEITLSILVNDAGEAPVFTTTPETQLYKGQSYSYEAQADDPEGGTVTYSLVAGPLGMTIDSGTGLVSWTPAVGETGDFDVVIQASDEIENTSEQAFTLTVFDSLEPPKLRYTPPDEAFVGEEYFYIPFADDYTGSSSVQVEFVSGPAGMVYEDRNGFYSLIWTPFEGDCIEDVTLRLTDQFGTSVDVTFSISVHAAPKKLNRIQCSLDSELCLF